MTIRHVDQLQPTENAILQSDLLFLLISRCEMCVCFFCFKQTALIRLSSTVCRPGLCSTGEQMERQGSQNPGNSNSPSNEKRKYKQKESIRRTALMWNNPCWLKNYRAFYQAWNILAPTLWESSTGAMGSCCREYLPCYRLHPPQLLSYWQFPSQAGPDYPDCPSWLLLWLPWERLHLWLTFSTLLGALDVFPLCFIKPEYANTR